MTAGGEGRSTIPNLKIQKNPEVEEGAGGAYFVKAESERVINPKGRTYHQKVTINQTLPSHARKPFIQDEFPKTYRLWLRT
jgi:hypothetical protein